MPPRRHFRLSELLIGTLVLIPPVALLTAAVPNPFDDALTVEVVAAELGPPVATALPLDPPLVIADDADDGDSADDGEGVEQDTTPDAADQRPPADLTPPAETPLRPTPQPTPAPTATPAPDTADQSVPFPEIELPEPGRAGRLDAPIPTPTAVPTATPTGQDGLLDLPPGAAAAFDALADAAGVEGDAPIDGE